jgi:N6-adenosine-specific RNA methylase IME4
VRDEQRRVCIYRVGISGAVRVHGDGDEGRMTKYRTIVADPPWEQPLMNKRERRRGTPGELPYPTMSLDEIKNLPIGDMAETGCHLWLWTTNAFLRQGFDVMESWGFRYLAPITWRKPSGMGNYFVHVTQTLLFGYFRKCQFNLERYLPTYFEGLPGRHSTKPKESYQLIERVSDPERLEIFARPWSQMFPIRQGWDVWGNEVESSVELAVK